MTVDLPKLAAMLIGNVRMEIDIATGKEPILYAVDGRALDDAEALHAFLGGIIDGKFDGCNTLGEVRAVADFKKDDDVFWRAITLAQNIAVEFSSDEVKAEIKKSEECLN